MGGGEKARDFKGTMKKLIDYLAVYKISILIVVIFAAISAALAVVGPKILGNVTTELFKGIIAKIQGTGDINFTYIRNTMLKLLFIYLISSIFAYIQGWIMSGVSMKVSYNLRKELSEKINRLPLKYFEKLTKERCYHV